jgi:hypothetical protein
MRLYHSLIHSHPPIPYFKVEGKKLTMVVVGVMSEIPDDHEIGRFLESFVIK